MIVKNRTKQGQGCPICGRKKSVISRACPVINTDTGEEFYSLSEASRIYHISSSCIKNCCNNKQSKAGGYSWKFKWFINAIDNTIGIKHIKNGLGV